MRTYQQRVIHEAVGALATHPRAEDVYEQVKKQHPTIGRATVYRNLHRMAAEGQLLDIGKIDGVTRYDHNTHPHYHFECKVCKKVYDIDGQLQDLCQQVSSPEGFDVQEHVTYFRGLCAGCK